VGYNSVTDNTGVSLLIRLTAVAYKSAKSREIPRKFQFIAV